MQVVVIINTSGGTVRERGVAALSRLIADTLREEGVEAQIKPVRAKELRAAIGAVAEASARPDALIVGGGDGTISSAARLLAGTDLPLGVLPLGTMNLFARSLAIPLDIAQAVRALARGDIANVDLGEVNGIPFVHHFSLGTHPRMVRMRDRLHYSSRLQKVAIGAYALSRTVLRPRRLDARWRAEDGERRARTHVLLVTNNLLRPALGTVPHAQDPQAGELALYTAKGKTSYDLFKLIVQVVLGGWQDSALLDVSTLRETAIDTGPRRLSASIDGEIMRMRPPFKCRILPGALKVLLPRPEA